MSKIESGWVTFSLDQNLYTAKNTLSRSFPALTMDHLKAPLCDDVGVAVVDEPGPGGLEGGVSVQHEPSMARTLVPVFTWRYHRVIV